VYNRRIKPTTWLFIYKKPVSGLEGSCVIEGIRMTGESTELNVNNRLEPYDGYGGTSLLTVSSNLHLFCKQFRFFVIARYINQPTASLACFESGRVKLVVDPQDLGFGHFRLLYAEKATNGIVTHYEYTSRTNSLATISNQANIHDLDLDDPRRCNTQMLGLNELCIVSFTKKGECGYVVPRVTDLFYEKATNGIVTHYEYTSRTNSWVATISNQANIHDLDLDDPRRCNMQMLGLNELFIVSFTKKGECGRCNMQMLGLNELFIVSFTKKGECGYVVPRVTDLFYGLDVYQPAWKVPWRRHYDNDRLLVTFYQQQYYNRAETRKLKQMLLCRLNRELEKYEKVATTPSCLIDRISVVPEQQVELVSNFKEIEGVLHIALNTHVGNVPCVHWVSYQTDHDTKWNYNTFHRFDLIIKWVEMKETEETV
nr:hypothetical protein [Tanacetum cinerariifolium]